MLACRALLAVESVGRQIVFPNDGAGLVLSMNGAAPIWMEHLRFAAVSDIGMRRLNNQDASLPLPAADEQGWQSRGHLFLVADGMGAHAAGELASRMAVQAVAHHYHKHAQLAPPEGLLRAMEEANAEIHQRGQANSEFHNMGTTCSALLLLPQGALIGHVGDSRVYRMRQGMLQQLTFDHSLLWEMRAAGQITNPDLALNIPKNVITRSLGPQSTVQVDLEGPFDVQFGDRFLMCTDGLMARLEDPEIGLLLSGLPPQEAAHLLVDLANIRGGPDNITVIVLEMTGDRARADPSRCLSGPGSVRSGARPRVCGFCWRVGALLALGLAAGGYAWWAIAPVAVGLMVLGWIAWRRHSPETDVPLAGGRRLGRGPYVRVDISAGDAPLLSMCRSVRESLAQYQDPGLAERPRMTACLEEAEAKARSGESLESLRMLAVAVQVFAEALRRPPVQTEGD